MAKSRFIPAVVAALLWLVCPAAAPLAEEDPEFFEVKPAVIVPVFAGTRLAGQISFVIVLELTSGTERSDIVPKVPRLRNAYLFDLKHYAEQHRNILRTIRTKSVKRLLMAASIRILGEGLVDAVLIERADVHQFR